MISLICFALAAICNAIQDKTTHHFDKSIFKNLNAQWWNGAISWKNKYVSIQTLDRKKWLGLTIPVQLTDAFHAFKSLMIVLIVISIVMYEPIKYWWLDIVIFGLVWNLTFSLFYDAILKNK